MRNGKQRGFRGVNRNNMPHPDEVKAVSVLLRELEHVVIVELGAHCGEEYRWISQACQGGEELKRYIMVEPDSRNCDAIKQAVGGCVTLYQGAIADTYGERTFTRSWNTNDHTRASGSIRKPTGHLIHIPAVQFTGSGPVDCYTLDGIFDVEELPKIDLLWVDIQGAENLMIQGGRRALRHTRYLFMEVEQLEMYEGEALKPELIGMLPGWKVLQEFEFNVLMTNTEFCEVGR